jgi:hypothetical protein
MNDGVPVHISDCLAGQDKPLVPFNRIRNAHLCLSIKSGVSYPVQSSMQALKRVPNALSRRWGANCCNADPEISETFQFCKSAKRRKHA